ncbi:MAG: hypothetical protein KGI89_17155 [Euryarchaeota archaeon]|nr:hypothetical protein [Euryarchaeota archaeon]
MAQKHPATTDAAIEPSEKPSPEAVEVVMACIKSPGTLLPESEDRSAEILMRMLQASTEEELDAVLAARLHPVTGSKDGELPPLTGRPLRVKRIGFNNGDESYRQEERTAIYAVLEVETEGGDTILASCGGESVVAYFAKRWAEGWLPVDVVISPSEKATRAGYHPLNVRRAEFKPL